jgi:hypothetical protein
VWLLVGVLVFLGVPLRPLWLKPLQLVLPFANCQLLLFQLPDYQITRSLIHSPLIFSLRMLVGVLLFCSRRLLAINFGDFLQFWHFWQS